MKIIDANVCLGGDFVKHPIVNHESFIIMDTVKTADTPAELLQVMDKFQIQQAAAWHRTMFDYDPIKGNEALTKLMPGYEDRILPVWSILPAIPDADFEPDVFFPKMQQNGVKLLKAFPQQNRYILCDAAMGDQLSAFQELNIPLYLEPQPDYQYIYNVLQEFPKLTVILCNIGIWPSERLIYPLFKRYPNVYLETGDMGAAHGYERVCERFGSERLLYGSNFPSNSPGCSLHSFMTAKLRDEERENIAHKNMERLLSEVKL